MTIHNQLITLGSICLIAPLLFATGCVTRKTTTTARSATEELLLSTATDHALTNTGLEIFAGKKVFLDSTYFDSYDSKYVLGTIRDALSRAGALVDNGLTNSDIVIEARSGALAIDESDTLVGVPNMTVPVPLAGALQTPEISFYKAQRQQSIAKFALLAYNRQSNAHLYSSGPLDGLSYDKRFHLLFLSWHRTDMPEKKSDPKMREKYQTWFRQDDLANLTPTNTATLQKK
jgi:hypothetical protein